MGPQNDSVMDRLEARFQRWALRRAAHPVARATLGWRNLYILPTWFGMVFALLLAVLLLAALNYGANMLFAMTFWLGAFFLLAMHRTHRNLLGLEMAIQVPREVFCGETLQWPVVLSHASTRPRYSIDLGWSRRPLVATHLEGPSGVMMLPQPTPHRGVLACPPVVVSSSHPFGLFRVWAHVYLAQQAVVYPAPISCAIQQASSAKSEEEHEGDLSAETEPGNELSGVRPYQRGDAMGRIAWKRSAGREDLVSKMTDGAAAPGTMILSLEALPMADLETRLSWLCAMVLSCEEQGMGYALLLGKTSIAAGSGMRHCRECLLALACFQP